MREIKYRGMRMSHTGQRLEWVYGNLVRYNHDGFKRWGISKINQDMCDFGEEDSAWGYQIIEVVPETVGQLTDQKDMNGKEVFEGDIFGWEYFSGGKKISAVGIVTWDDSEDGFDFGDHRRPSFCERELIGNIHENPELVKSNKEKTKT